MRNQEIIKGRDLNFVSQINRDGSGTTKLDKNDEALLLDEEFIVFSLSISNGTFIASGFNSYVVKKLIPAQEHFRI